MKLDVNGSGKALTKINIRETKVKKEEPESTELSSNSVTEQRNLTMNVSKKEGVLKSIKTGITTSFAAPFGLALGLSPTLVTLLTAIPQLLGSVSVLFVEKLINFLHRRKKLMVLSSYMESCTWLLVLIMAALSIHSPWLLIALVTLDAIFINIQYPIWNSIMSDTVPNNLLGKYFGFRNLLVGISSLLSVIIAGAILNKTAGFNHPLLGFAIVFGVSFLAAYAATTFQTKMIDPNPHMKKDTKHSFKEFIFTIRENNFGMYTGFFSIYQMVVYIASPFYAIYMLKILNFDYLTFTIISTISAVSALGSMKLWGKLVDKYGSKKIMSITAFIIPFSPIFWMMTTNWHLLTVIEFCSGIVWAGFNLSCSTFMFESVKPEHKVKFYTYNKVLYGVGVFLGAMFGILLINIPPIIFSSSILLIFFVSGTLRMITAIIFIPRIQEEKVVTINFKEGPFFKHIITLRPKEGATFMVGGHHPVDPEKERLMRLRFENQKKDKNKQPIAIKIENKTDINANKSENKTDKNKSNRTKEDKSGNTVARNAQIEKAINSSAKNKK